MPLRTKFRYQIYNVRGILGYLGLFGQLHAPLILVGSPRSGTRALGSAIAVHPQIDNRSEARLLWDKDFHARSNDTRKVAEDVRRVDAIRLQGNFCYYQWISGKHVVLNRHPENSLRIHFIKKIFPSAKIVHIIRDGRATVCSAYRRVKTNGAKYPFGGFIRPPDWRNYLDRSPLEQLSYMWNETVLYAAREGSKYGSDYMEVLYEELPENSTAIVEKIWQLGGLSYSRDWFDRMPRFDNQNHKWRHELSNEEIRVIEDLAGDGLRHFHYL